MIRDIIPDPIPQGCPFSFIAQLKKLNNSSTEAFLGALRYDNCDIPAKPEDPVSRKIKDWFAFAVDQKTTGLWGYYDEGNYNFKVTAGGKKTGPPPETKVEGKNQALLEMWNSEYYGLTHYVNEGEESEVEGTTAKKQSGFFYYTPGDANYFQLFVTDGEASIWGFTSSSWQYKLAAESSSAVFQLWEGPNGSDDQPPAGYAEMYAYSNSAGFSCSKSDDISSTLEPSSLFCKDSTSKDLQGTYYAGGANIWEDGKYTQIDASSITCDDGSTDSKYYAGGAYITGHSGSGTIDLTPVGQSNCEIRKIEFVASDGGVVEAYFLCSDPESVADSEKFATEQQIKDLGIEANCDTDGNVTVELTGQPQ